MSGNNRKRRAPSEAAEAAPKQQQQLRSGKPTKKLRVAAAAAASPELTPEQIRQLEELVGSAVRGGQLHSGLPQLLAAARLHGEDRGLLQTVIAATQACSRLFVGLAEQFPGTQGSARKLLRTLRKPAAGSKQKLQELQLWIVEQRVEFQRDCLRALLVHEHEVVLQSTLAALMELVLVDGGRLEPGATEATASLWHRVLLALLLRAHPLSAEVWNSFLGKYALRYGDLGTQLCASLQHLCTQGAPVAAFDGLLGVLFEDPESLPPGGVCGRELFTRALFKLLLLVSQASRQQPTSAPVFREAPPAGLWCMRNGAVTVAEPKQLAARLSDCWLGYLRLEALSAPTCLAILQYMKSSILPCLARPIVVSDFLVEAYNMSGLVALLALDGLFHLIHAHNLDYPDFYAKLYSLLSPQRLFAAGAPQGQVVNNLFLHVEHRARLYELLPVFLSSAYLPQNFVASFVKRLARLSVTVAPPDFAVFAIMLGFRLLKRHPTLRTLVHRAKAGGKLVRAREATESFFRLLAPKAQDSDALLVGDKPSSAAAGADAEGKQREEDEAAAAAAAEQEAEIPEAELGQDPYDPEQEDLAKTGALRSSLWEFKALEKHYMPLVARQAKLFFDGFGVNKPGSHMSRETMRVEAAVQEEMEKNVRDTPLSYDGLLEAELKWRKNQRMPLAFDSQVMALFPADAGEAEEDEAESVGASLALSFTPRCFSGGLFSSELLV